MRHVRLFSGSSDSRAQRELIPTPNTVARSAIVSEVGLENSEFFARGRMCVSDGRSIQSEIEHLFCPTPMFEMIGAINPAAMEAIE
jgi:hypothetical protein